MGGHCYRERESVLDSITSPWKGSGIQTRDLELASLFNRESVQRVGWCVHSELSCQSGRLMCFILVGAFSVRVASFVGIMRCYKPAWKSQMCGSLWPDLCLKGWGVVFQAQMKVSIFCCHSYLGIESKREFKRTLSLDHLNNLRADAVDGGICLWGYDILSYIMSFVRLKANCITCRVLLTYFWNAEAIITAPAMLPNSLEFSSEE